MLEPWMGCADPISAAIHALITLNRTSLLTSCHPSSLETETTTTSSPGHVARSVSAWEHALNPSANRYDNDPSKSPWAEGNCWHLRGSERTSLSTLPLLSSPARADAYSKVRIRSAVFSTPSLVQAMRRCTFDSMCRTLRGEWSG